MPSHATMRIFRAEFILAPLAVRGYRQFNPLWPFIRHAINEDHSPCAISLRCSWSCSSLQPRLQRRAAPRAPKRNSAWGMIFINCVPDEWPKRIELAVTAYGKGGQDEFGAEDAHCGMAGHWPVGRRGGPGAERPDRGSDCSARAEAGGRARRRGGRRGER